MQGVSADPSLPSRMIEAYKQNQATITVTGVTDLGNGTLTADAQVAVAGGAPQNAVVPFVAEDGKWKVQKEWICNMLSLANQTSRPAPSSYPNEPAVPVDGGLVRCPRQNRVNAEWVVPQGMSGTR